VLLDFNNSSIQTVNSVDIQTVNSVETQAVNSVEVQAVNSVEVQAVNSVDVQDANSVNNIINDSMEITIVYSFTHVIFLSSTSTSIQVQVYKIH